MELTIVLFSTEQSRVSFFLCVLSTKYHTPFNSRLIRLIRLTTQIHLNEHRIDVIYREIQDRLYAYTCIYMRLLTVNMANKNTQHLFVIYL